METDQFTTPPAPLYDIGVALSRKIVEIIESDRTGADPERVVSDWVGSNIFSSRLGRWVKQFRVADGLVSFLPGGIAFSLSRVPGRASPPRGSERTTDTGCRPTTKSRSPPSAGSTP